MEHLLLEHELTPDMGLELLRLLSRNHYFRRDDRELAAAVWVRRCGPIRDAPVVESRAWELIGWLLTDVVPSVLRTFGCDEHANRVEDVSGTLDLAAAGDLDEPFATEAALAELEAMSAATVSKYDPETRAKAVRPVRENRVVIVICHEDGIWDHWLATNYGPPVWLIGDDRRSWVS